MATRITEIQRRFRCDFFAAQAFEHLEAQLAAVVLGELCGAIEDARAQPEQPPQQQPANGDSTPIQSGECAFLDELPKGPSIGRFSDSERAELDELKRKAFKAGEP